MGELQITKEEIIAHIKSSRERLEAAEILLKAAKYADSISRSYYAFLDIARAALLAKKIIPTSHEGTVQLFGLHFVKSGVVPPEYGRKFSKALELRMDADYERMMTFSEEDASGILAEAKDFVAKVSEIVAKELGD